MLDRTFDEGAWEKVLEALPLDDQKVLENVILAAQWYPFELGERVDKAIVKVLGKGKESIFEQLGAQSARRSLAKDHQSFLTPGDPQSFMKRATSIYGFYYDTGYREYEETGPNSGVMTTYDAETFSAVDCLTVIGWYKEALKICGATQIEVVEEECRAKQGSCCRYRFQWKM